MSNEQIEHSLDDIMRDSYIWSQSAEELGQAAALAERLPVNEAQFSYLAVTVGIHERYEQIREELRRLLSEGQQAQEAIAEKLFTAAKHYEDSEQEALERIREIEREEEGGS